MKATDMQPINIVSAPRPLAGNSATAFENVDVFDRDGHLRTLEAIERDLIQLAIDTYDGRMTEVARRLGMGRSMMCARNGSRRRWLRIGRLRRRIEKWTLTSCAAGLLPGTTAARS